MDTLSSILLTAFGKIANKAVSDSYQKIKSYLTKKLGEDNKVSDGIENLKDAPENEENQQALDQAVAEQGLLEDKDFVNLLNGLKAQTDMASIQVNMSGNAKVQGVVGAKEVTVGEMNFSND